MFSSQHLLAIKSILWQVHSHAQIPTHDNDWHRVQIWTSTAKLSLVFSGLFPSFLLAQAGILKGRIIRNTRKGVVIFPKKYSCKGNLTKKYSCKGEKNSCTKNFLPPPVISNGQSLNTRKESPGTPLWNERGVINCKLRIWVSVTNLQRSERNDNTLSIKAYVRLSMYTNQTKHQQNFFIVFKAKSIW